MERLVVYRELGKLWDKGMKDPVVNYGGYEPCRVRLDVIAHQILREQAGDTDSDVSIYRDGLRWRGLPILVERGLPILVETVRPWGPYASEGGPSLMCIEFRQPGEHGRSLYFDWQADDAALLDRPSKRRA